MLAVMGGIGSHARLRRNRRTRLGTMRASLVRVGLVGGVLRISRLGRGHTSFVYGLPGIIPRATRAIRHQRIRGSPARARARARLQDCDWGVAPIVRVPDALGWLLGLLWGRRRRRSCIMGRRRWCGTPSKLLGYPVCLLVRPHLLLRLGARGPLSGTGLPAKGLPVGCVRIPRLRGRVNVRNPTRPRARSGRPLSAAIKHRLLGLRRWCLWWRTRARASPLRPRGPNSTGSLVSLRMNIRGSRCGATGLSATEQLESGLDVWVRRVELGSALVGIEGIRNLVVAGFILT